MNILHATMPIWIGALIVLAVVLLALAGWLKSWETSLNASRIEVRLITQRDEARKQRDELKRENEGLHNANKAWAEQNTKLREDMTEANATIELLRLPSNHATAPLQEAAPVKRTRKKAETKQ